MTRDDSLRLVPIDDADANRSRLVAHDGSSPAEVQGRVLEAAFRCTSGLLVLTSDGDPYEDVLHFHLFGPDMSHVDTVSLGQIYSPASLRSLSVCGEDCLEFSFFGSERWRLTVADRPRRRWKPDGPGAVHYGGGWFSHHRLRLERLTRD